MCFWHCCNVTGKRVTLLWLHLILNRYKYILPDQVTSWVLVPYVIYHSFYKFYANVFIHNVLCTVHNRAIWLNRYTEKSREEKILIRIVYLCTKKEKRFRWRRRNHATMKITALHLSKCVHTLRRRSLRKHLERKKWSIMQCANQANDMCWDDRSHGCDLDWRMPLHCYFRQNCCIFFYSNSTTCILPLQDVITAVSYRMRMCICFDLSQFVNHIIERVPTKS